MKSWFRYLMYASIVFLAAALYKTDYIAIPQIHSPAALAGSFAFLFLGFLCDPVSWKFLLEKSGYPAPHRECFAAVGLYVFTKYIPGKIWTIVGRSGYLADRHPYPMSALTSMTVLWQLICVWLGVIFGAIGLTLLGKILVWGWPILILWLVLTIVVFSDAAQTLARRVYKRVFRREITIPTLSARLTVLSLPWFVVMWLCLSIAFHLLVVALAPNPVPLGVGFGFPLTITLGVFAAFAPGGIGVREGVMVGYLALAGIPPHAAAAISIAARIWFILGELFMFVVGLAASAWVKRTAARRQRT
jgi:uncharacterized membrane protein YbhN (UPF0104 family)